MIFKLQRKTDLALSALRCLGAAPEHRLTGVELAEAIETTMSFLPQVMAPLLRSGWVVSERGPAAATSSPKSPHQRPGTTSSR